MQHTFPEGEAFASLVKIWRKDKGISQSSLADTMQTTTRNLSFIETGKIKPTRSMVKRLAKALDLSNGQYAEFQRAAGFAYDHQINDNQAYYQDALLQAMDLFFEKHLPYPAVAMNRKFEITHINQGVIDAIKFFLGLDFDKSLLPISLFDLLLAPGLFNHLFSDVESYTRFLIQRLHREQLDNLKDSDIIPQLKNRFPDVPNQWWEFEASYLPSPSLCNTLEFQGEVYENISVISSLGSPHDFGGNNTRIIAVYPKNEACKDLFNSW